MGGLQVIGELAEIGYDAEWRVVSAAGVGAPHRRDRIIIVAYPNGSQSSNGGQYTDVQSKNQSWGDDGSGSGSNFREICMGSTGQTAGDVAHATQLLSNGSDNNPRVSMEHKEVSKLRNNGRAARMANTDAREIVGRHGGYATNRDKVFSRGDYERGTQSYEGWQWWEVEPDVGRVADGVPSRVDRLKGLGNAVVPQVAEYIGRLVMAAHNNS